MDGGSSINILYYETFQRMKLRDEQLVPTITTFHGIVPGKKAYPLGKIALDVVFGTAKNFRLEKIWFEVVNFRSSYHAILGRPAFAKFMARPCYAYLKMKLPGPNGIITVHGDVDRAIECEKGNAVFAESVIATEQLEQLKLQVDPNDMTIVKKPTLDSRDKFMSAQETKRIPLVEGTPPRRRSSACTWTSHRKARSANSSVRIGTSSHGNHLTCQASRGSSQSTSSTLTPS